MKQITYNLFISSVFAINSLFFVACSQNDSVMDTEGKTPEQIAELLKEKQIKNINIDFGSTVYLKYSEYIIIPLRADVINVPEGLLERAKKVVRGKYYSSSNDAQLWNLLFYNPQNQQYHLLDEKSEFEIIGYDTDTDSTQSIFYTILNDTSKDSIFNNADLAALCISDRNGKSFRQISPAQSDLNFYYKNPKTNDLMLYVVENRLPIWYQMDLNKPDSLQKVFSDEFLKNIKKSIQERTCLIKAIKSAKEEDKSKIIPQLYFGNPDTLLKSNYLVIPILSYQYEKEKYLGSYGYDYDNTSQDLWNFLFYNFKDKSYHLLVNEELQILSNSMQKTEEAYDTEPIKSNNNINNDFIFYTVRKDNYNKDSVLNYLDPEYLYISDKEGKNFQQISPINANVQNWERLGNTSKILMYVLEDINNDKKFDGKDENFWYEVDLKNPTKSLRKIFDSQFIRLLKSNFAERRTIQKLNQKK